MARRKIPGIKQLKDGRYQVRVTVGKDAEGKPIRRKRICESHADARRAKEDLQQEFDAEKKAISVITVAQFVDQWMTQDVEPHLKRNTIASYKQQASRYITPLVGHINLCDLSPTEGNNFAAQLREQCVPESTQKYVLRLLSQICKRAVERELMLRNPMLSVRRPKIEKPEIKPFTQAESMAILKHVSGWQMGAVYFLGLCHGVRMGEAFGLRWQDVDFEAKLVHIRQALVYGDGKLNFEPPKSKAGLRTIELTTRTLDELNNRRKLQVSSGQAGHELVFTNKAGKPVRPPVWWRDEWARVLKHLEIDHRGFHHTRHTYATLALSENVPVTVVSKVLGHANPKITMEIYAHALDEHQAKAVEAIERLFAN